MTTRSMRQDKASHSPLTDEHDLDRVFAAMAGWWDGWSLARIGRAIGVSRQRVSAILARVACTEEMRHKADRDRADSDRRAHQLLVDQARTALLHPLSHRLTPRQRGALAWQAQALVLVDAARRMGVTCQGVQRLIVAGRMRLERFERKQAARAAEKAARETEEPPGDDGIVLLPIETNAILSNQEADSHA